MEFKIEPIGYLRSKKTKKHELARQASVNAPEDDSYIELVSGKNFEQALEGLDGFSKIWLIYGFHENTNWKPMVAAPRIDHKVGVFASRAPYRPNQLGLSAVDLIEVNGLKIKIGAHDLLDGSPIYDIKPYLPYADSFPDEKTGWVEKVENQPAFAFRESPFFTEQADYLENEGLPNLRSFLHTQLEFAPTDMKRKRIITTNAGYQIAYKTWRIDYFVDAEAKTISFLQVISGYSKDELNNSEDVYQDKDLHHKFSSQF